MQAVLNVKLSDIDDNFMTIIKDLISKEVEIVIRTPIHSKGVPGVQMLNYAGFIPPDDLKMMKEAIEADCERVDTIEKINVL